MVLRKEANRKNSPGKAGRGTEAALSYHVFSVENYNPPQRNMHNMEHGIAAKQLQPTGNLLEYAESRINYLSAQLTERTNELERLREYTTQLEEGEKGLIQELTQQLSIKDNEISRIAALCAKKESENRKLSASFEANINSQKEYAERIKSILVKKEGETANLIEGLQKELEKRDAEIASLRSSLLERKRSADSSLPSLPEENLPAMQAATLQRELESRNRELKRFEKLLIDEQKLNAAVQNRLKQQILEMMGQAEQLKSFIVEKEKTIQSLESTFEGRLAAKDSELSHVKGLLHTPLTAKEQLESSAQKSRKGEHQHHLEHTGRLVEHLKKELESKETEIISLREQILKKSKAGSLIASGAGADFGYPGFNSTQAELLLRNSEEKGRELKRLEKALFDEQKLNKSVQTRLKEQTAEMASQIEGLKSFIIEKEKLAQSLESAFEKRIAAKEEELRHMKGVIHAKPETKLHKQADELKSELHIKEETAKLMAEEVAKVKEQSALLRKRLEERQRIFFESEKAYEELIAKLREQHEARLKAIVQESSQKEAALKVAVEEERVKMRQETVLMKEKEKQIDETIHAFATTSQQLIKLQGSGQLGEMTAGVEIETINERAKQLGEQAKYLESKEAELKALLTATEARITELKSKEVDVERKEQLLLREQEAIGKELDVLASAGVEIGRSKKYIQQKLEQIGGFEQPSAQSQQAWQPQQPMQAPTEIAGEQQEQPFLSQAKQQNLFAEKGLSKTGQQPSMQEMGLGSRAGVEEAQEEEGIDAPRFTGITSEAPGAAAGEVKDAIEEREDFAPTAAASIKKAPAAAASASRKVKATITPKIKTAAVAKAQKLPKKQNMLATGKLKPAVKKALKQKKRPLHQQPKQKLKPLQFLKKAAVAAKEVPKGLALPEELRGKEGQELFTELGGYSELEEIRSIVEVGLQHGDSIEQIRQSLTVSGYSKKNIEKALGSIKK
ncbi:hypothetical protein HYV85_01060 [Candidatus Woesearchaeota archaeon]|nr:hypothetical protein [Candidatus Woesearchaeota archaeon]